MSEGDYVGRVSQVDAFDFDTEILEQVWEHSMSENYLKVFVKRKVNL